ncbi:unnamed protein product [Chrysoparadoxa australica]
MIRDLSRMARCRSSAFPQGGGGGNQMIGNQIILWRRELADCTGRSGNTIALQRRIASDLRAGELGSAREIFRGMKAEATLPDKATYGLLIGACRRRGNRELAKELRAEMQGLEPRAISYDDLISTASTHPARVTKELQQAASEGKTELLRPLMKEAEAAGVVLDRCAFSAAIGGLAPTDAKEALELLDEMKAKDISPSAVIYGNLIEGCRKVEAWDKVDELVREMREAGLQPADV